jgi:quercetin dioxygenase-like cupin family protein
MFNNFFTTKSDNYIKAKKGLTKIKSTFKSFVIAFPDVTPDEIILIKNSWETLPTKIALGVKIMGLSFKNGFKSLLVYYNPNSYIVPHAHNEEFEIGKILKGSITNRLTGKTYNINDEYIFSPNEIHYLSSSKDGCIVHSVLTNDGEYELKPLSKKLLNTLESA